MATLFLLPVLAAATLYSPTSTTAERVAALTPLFSPRVGETIFIDQREKTRRKKRTTRDFRGYINVSPPKGSCLWITRNTAEPDTKVCKPSLLHFTPEHLSTTGNLIWSVKIKGVPEPTQLLWPTPYRLVSFINSGERSITETYLDQCKAFYGPDKTRMVKVKLIGGETWIVTFPKKDVVAHIYKYDEKKADEVFTRGAGPTTKKSGELKSKVLLKKKEQTLDPQIDPKYAAKVGSRDFAGPEEPGSEKINKAVNPVQRYWTTLARGAFTMGSKHFQSDDAPRPNMGTCRYRFSNADTEENVGSVECHDTSAFDVIYMKLPCLNKFARD